MKLKKGTIALCSLGCFGLITEDSPRPVVYKDGNSAIAYVGVHLTDKIAPVGSPWRSRTPVVVGDMEPLLVLMLENSKK